VDGRLGKSVLVSSDYDLGELHLQLGESFGEPFEALDVGFVLLLCFVHHANILRVNVGNLHSIPRLRLAQTTLDRGSGRVPNPGVLLGHYIPGLGRREVDCSYNSHKRCDSYNENPKLYFRDKADGVLYHIELLSRVPC